MLKKNSYKQWGIYRVGCSVMKSDWSDEVKWRKISDSSSKWMWSVLKAVVAGDVIEVAILEFDCALKLKVAVMGRRPSKRGVGLSFGGDVTKKFLEENNLDLVVRSHEVKDEGYEIDHDGKLITVFSAPNYCDQMGNKGAYIKFKAPELKPDIVSYSAVPHPDVKPMAYASNFLRMFA